MSFDELDAYLKSKPVINIQFIAKWNRIRYLVGDRTFAMISLSPKKLPILTVKCRTQELQQNRADYPKQIVPAFEMESIHWSSIFFTSNIPDSYILHMIDMSYALVAGQTKDMTIAHGGNAKIKYKNVINAYDFSFLQKSDTFKFSYIKKSINNNVASKIVQTDPNLINTSEEVAASKNNSRKI